MQDLMELVNGCKKAVAEKTEKVPEAKETHSILSKLGFVSLAERINDRIQPILKRAEIAAGGYIEITPKKIQDFLERKANDYDEAKLKKQKKKENPYSAAAHNLALSALNNYMQHSFYNTTGTFNSIAERQQMPLSGATQTWPPSPVEASSASYYRQQETAQEVLIARTCDYSSSDPEAIGKFAWAETPVERYTEGVPPKEILKTLEKEMDKKVFDYYTIASVNAVRDPLLLGRIKGSQDRWFLGQWGDDVSLDDVI